MIGGMSDVALQLEEEGWEAHPKHYGMYVNQTGQIATLSMILHNKINLVVNNPFGKEFP